MVISRDNLSEEKKREKMCRKLSMFGIPSSKFLEMSAWASKSIERMHHGGPNPVGTWISQPHEKTGKINIMAHKRLSLNGAASGVQPLFSEDRKVVLSVNGEVWNHKKLEKEHKLRVEDGGKHHFATESDCEVFIHLYEELRDKMIEGKVAQPELYAMIQMLKEVDAMFSLCLYDGHTDTVLIARGHIGKVQHYWGVTEDGILCESSEQKAIHDKCSFFQAFPAGHVYYCTNVSSSATFSLASSSRGSGTGGTGSEILTKDTDSKGLVNDDEILMRWYTPPWILRHLTASAKKEKEKEGKEGKEMKEIQYAVPVPVSDFEPPPELVAELKQVVTDSIISHLMMDPGIKFFASNSGGLDSAITTYVAAKHLQETTGERLHTASVGLRNSPDLLAARVMAKHCNTIHHEFVITPGRLCQNVEHTIYYLETFYVTTVRAGTPMKILMEEMSKLGMTMNLSGEVSDEIFGGYSCQHKCPSEEEFDAEAARKVTQLCDHDCKRASQICLSHSIECRVPFGSVKVVDFVMDKIPARYKMCGRMVGGRIEKYILRKAFESVLPASIVWRKKVQFSSGSGGIEHLKAWAEEQVSDEEMKNAGATFVVNTPHNKEAYLYRKLFHKHYPTKCSSDTVPLVGKTIACSSAEIMHWDPSFAKNPDDCGSSVDTGIKDEFEALVKSLLAKDASF